MCSLHQNIPKTLNLLELNSTATKNSLDLFSFSVEVAQIMRKVLQSLFITPQSWVSLSSFCLKVNGTRFRNIILPLFCFYWDTMNTRKDGYSREVEKNLTANKYFCPSSQCTI